MVYELVVIMKYTFSLLVIIYIYLECSLVSICAPIAPASDATIAPANGIVEWKGKLQSGERVGVYYYLPKLDRQTIAIESISNIVFAIPNSQSLESVIVTEAGRVFAILYDVEIINDTTNPRKYRKRMEYCDVGEIIVCNNGDGIKMRWKTLLDEKTGASARRAGLHVLSLENAKGGKIIIEINIPVSVSANVEQWYCYKIQYDLAKGVFEEQIEQVIKRANEEHGESVKRN